MKNYTTARALTLGIILFVGLDTSVIAQIPQTISFQGVLLGENGPLPDGEYSVLFNLYDDETGPRVAWSETQSVIVTDGRFTVYLGQVNPITLDFDRPFWLGTSVDGGSESDPRIALSAVPYAFMARALEDSVVTGRKIANGHVVRSLNGLKDDVVMMEGENVSLETKDDTLIIASTASGGARHSLDAQDGSETDVVFVDDQSNVGVGTTSPVSKLHVMGDIRIDDSSPFLILRGSGSTKGVTIQQGDQPQADLYYGNGSGLRAQLTGAPTSSWLLATNGNFGIGLPGGTVPAEKLDVDGNIKLTGMIVQPSDRRLKEEIRSLPYGLSEMLKLQPVSYRAKYDLKSTRFGLLADDVQDVIPELVRQPAEEGGYLGLSYTELIPILIKAIQEQQAEIEDLRAQVSGLR